MAANESTTLEANAASRAKLTDHEVELLRELVAELIERRVAPSQTRRIIERKLGTD